MGDITKNISRRELKCRCGNCGCEFVDYQAIEAVQGACDYFAEIRGLERVTLHITSAARCPDHNAAVGGAKKSKHVAAGAIDHYIQWVSAEDLAEYYRGKYPGKFGIGEYQDKGFVHLDSRSTEARWKG
jgi:uncharacterized protein YcbK (DUF882 family)